MVYKQLEQRGMAQPPVNISTLRAMKAERQPIACVTAYDASFACIVDEAGADLVLVGDSLGMVVQGTTPPCRSRSPISFTTPAWSRVACGELS